MRVLRRPSSLWIGTLVAFVLLALAAAVRAADWSYGADTGTFVQIILGAFGGMYDGVEGTTHYRFHWSPSLVLLWPFLAATRSLWVLQTILAAASVACAPLLAAIARARGTPRGIADRIGAVALVYPPLVAVGFAEFRDLGLLPPLALGWWLAVQRRAWAWVAVLALLLAGLREDVCIELAIVGVVVAIGGALQRDDAGRPDRALIVAGLGSAALGIASDAVYALVVLPRVGPWPPSHFYDYPFAHGPGALLLAPVLHPLAFFAAILTVGRLTYVLEALVPLAFVPLRSRLVWLALPGFAIVLLANSGLVWRMGMHYAALWIPWLLIAFAGGIMTLRAPRRWTTTAFVLSAIVLIAFSPLHPLHYLKPSYHDLRDARAALSAIPAGASLATHDEWYTATAARHPRAMVLGTGPSPYDADYVVFAEDYPNDDFQRRVLPQLRERLASGRYTPIRRFGSVMVWRAAPGGARWSPLGSASPSGAGVQRRVSFTGRYLTLPLVYQERSLDRMARHRLARRQLHSQAAGAR
ncbi:MAG TPA: DUF2079 domain-containing protein [Candidatus Elarobacter sp.]|nr:DUF2079 domain-containing protein [Candidatus Elarobacter sp.]